METKINKVIEYLETLEGELFTSPFQEKNAVYLEDGKVVVDFLLPFDFNNTLPLDKAIQYLKFKDKLEKEQVESNGIFVADMTSKDNLQNVEQNRCDSFVTVTVDLNTFDGNLEEIKEKIIKYCNKVKKEYNKIAKA